MAHGSWLMAHGSWLMAHGSWLMAHGSWLMAHGYLSNYNLVNMVSNALARAPGFRKNEYSITNTVMLLLQLTLTPEAVDEAAVSAVDADSMVVRVSYEYPVSPARHRVRAV